MRGCMITPLSKAKNNEFSKKIVDFRLRRLGLRHFFGYLAHCALPKSLYHPKNKAVLILQCKLWASAEKLILYTKPGV